MVTVTSHRDGKPTQARHSIGHKSSNSDIVNPSRDEFLSPRYNLGVKGQISDR